MRVFWASILAFEARRLPLKPFPAWITGLAVANTHYVGAPYGISNWQLYPSIQNRKRQKGSLMCILSRYSV
jgi:hypothetical protein